MVLFSIHAIDIAIWQLYDVFSFRYPERDLFEQLMLTLHVKQAFSPPLPLPSLRTHTRLLHILTATTIRKEFLRTRCTKTVVEVDSLFEGVLHEEPRIFEAVEVIGLVIQKRRKSRVSFITFGLRVLGGGAPTWRLIRRIEAA